jgi:hypothetical protein
MNFLNFGSICLNWDKTWYLFHIPMRVLNAKNSHRNLYSIIGRRNQDSIISRWNQDLIIGRRNQDLIIGRRNQDSIIGRRKQDSINYHRYLGSINGNLINKIESLVVGTA